MNEPTIKIPEGVIVDLPRLLTELRSAQVGIDSIGGRGDELIAYDADGKPIAWSAEAVVIVEAHRPPPTELTRDERIIAAADVRKERLAAKKSAIQASSLPAATKTAMADLLDGMADIVDGLVEAIRGERP